MITYDVKSFNNYWKLNLTYPQTPININLVSMEANNRKITRGFKNYTYYNNNYSFLKYRFLKKELKENCFQHLG